MQSFANGSVVWTRIQAIILLIERVLRIALQHVEADYRIFINNYRIFITYLYMIYDDVLYNCGCGAVHWLQVVQFVFVPPPQNHRLDMRFGWLRQQLWVRLLQVAALLCLTCFAHVMFHCPVNFMVPEKSCVQQSQCTTIPMHIARNTMYDTICFGTTALRFQATSAGCNGKTCDCPFVVWYNICSLEPPAGFELQAFRLWGRHLQCSNTKSVGRWGDWAGPTYLIFFGCLLSCRVWIV